MARNRNARGQNYGFVRYINVKNVSKLQKALNNVYFDQNKVWANVARFDRFGDVKKELLNGLEDGKKSAAVGGKNKSKNNADEGGKNKSKNSEKIVVKEKIKEGENVIEGGSIDSEKEEMVLARKHALEQVKLNAKGSEKEREQERLGGEAKVTRKFHSDNEDVVWASKGALAKVLNGDFIPIVQQKIIDAGFHNVRVVPRGGDNVILFCPGKEDMMSVYLAAADFFNCFFTDMRAWSLSEDNVPERGVWLRFYGVPLHVWHIKFFEFISSSCGRMLKIDPCTTNLERLDCARILVSTECLDTINAVENILIDDKHYSIKIVEELEAGCARDVCFEEEFFDSASEFSEHVDELNIDEPIVDALVQDLKEVWENSATKQTAAHSDSPSDTQNSHVSASFDIQQKPGLLHIDPVLSAPSKGQSSSPSASKDAAGIMKSTKATSCSNTRKSHSTSGPWSSEWIKRHKATHNPSLISIRRIARMSPKDRQNLIHMLKKTKNKAAAPSRSSCSKNKECLDVKSSSTTSGADWKNWLSLRDKSIRGSQDIVDIGKTINLQFKGDCSNMFQALSRPNKLERKTTNDDVSVEGSHANVGAFSAGC